MEVRRRYKRTALGPFWTTGSTAIFVGALGFLWSSLWSLPTSDYLPFLAIGFIAWSFFAANVSECCLTFVTSQPIIMQTRLPFFLYLIVVIWRNLIFFLHNFLVVIVIFILFPFELSLSSLLFVPGILLLSFNCLWMGLILAIVSTRFRDIPSLVSSVLQISMLVTPIMWPVSALEGRSHLIFNLNPVYHLIEIVRQPLLGNQPTGLNWTISVGLAVFGSMIALTLFARFRKRIPYWI